MPKWVSQPSARSNRRKENFSWTRRTSCLQSRNHLFLGSGCQNESNSHQLLESARRKFFMNSTYIDVYKVGITFFFCSGCQNESNSHQLAESARREFFITRRTSCLQSRNHLFLGSGCQNEFNSQKSARRKFFMNSTYIVYEESFLRAKMSLTAIIRWISRRKFWHHVYKVGITCFCAQDAKMSLTAISSLESARREFFMNSTYIMSTK